MQRIRILWDVSCDIHDILSTEKIIKIAPPDTTLIAHPDCPRSYYCRLLGSPTAMLNYTKNLDSKKFIVATRIGILHQMQKDPPKKEHLFATQESTL